MKIARGAATKPGCSRTIALVEMLEGALHAGADRHQVNRPLRRAWDARCTGASEFIAPAFIARCTASSEDDAIAGILHQEYK